MSAEQPTIGLCMIVRDEAAVIERCLASVRGLISTWTICDTGSGDGTQEMIRAALGDLPGTLHDRPWRDFGHNRSELMELAAGSADYLLLLDADMTLVQEGPLPPLDADAYLLRHDGDLAYWITRLVRGNRRWRFEGVTHEYLAGEEPFAQERLAELVVIHHADGGSRADKLQRDRRLLEAQLEGEPAGARTVFYLAQTLRDQGDDAVAAELYRRRAAMGDWEEEAYYAAFQAGVLTGRSNPEAGIQELRAAVELRPSRGEARYELARLLRVEGRHDEAREVAAGGAALAVPGDVLFVHRDVHTWGLRFEQAMAAHHAGRPEEALELADALLSEGRLPWDVEAALRESRPYFVAAADRDDGVAAAPLLATLAPSFGSGRIALDAEPRWPAFNPSIAADGDGFRMVVRTANYRIAPDGAYDIFDADGIVRTVNYLLHLDRDLGIRRVEPLGEPAERPPSYPSPVVGFEDVRPVLVGNRWFALATCRDATPGSMTRMALLELAEGGVVARARLLPGPDPGRVEKNWMPFTAGEDLLIVYGMDPCVVLRCDVDTAAVTDVARTPGPAWAASFRGGSQGIGFAGSRLFVIHEVVREAEPRQYVHRFALLDEHHRLTAASQRFTLAGANIEMCIGLASRGDDLVITYGVEDAEAWIGVVPSNDVVALLEPV